MSAADQPDVRPGQVWADNDRRVEGRTLVVDSVTATHALCTVRTNDTETQRLMDTPPPGGHWGRLADRRGKPTRIALRRFRPTSTGYRLVTDTPEES